MSHRQMPQSAFLVLRAPLPTLLMLLALPVLLVGTHVQASRVLSARLAHTHSLAPPYAAHVIRARTRTPLPPLVHPVLPDYLH